ncbi:hypothetical protein [Arthrobacter sp. MYb213]|uniref:hypothetical protein n=1 Tax=Arthrobacter sp. MYb213 TaxID=1848595 RepID=UPI000D47104E|nr:hypothetical protein [Arthrobacter sp. MYb213]PRB66813.1 hypothetical protein CQ011_17345 [Arthrobacter sp. MYb213]
MNQEQSPTPTEALGALEKATKELEQTTKKFEQETQLRQGLDQAGFLDTRDLKSVQDKAVEKAKDKQEEAAKKVAEALKNASTAYSVGQPTEDEARKLTEIRGTAAAVLTKLPPQAFDWKKIRRVIISLVGACVIIGATIAVVPSGKGTVIAGLAIAVIGQFCESAKKASDVKANPRLEDGLALFGEAIKFLGALTVLIGALTDI